MKGHVINIEKESLENINFRKVLYTAKNSQLVVMSLKPKEEIGSEVHELDQFIRVEKGRGKPVWSGVDYDIAVASLVFGQNDMENNKINTDLPFHFSTLMN